MTPKYPKKRLLLCGIGGDAHCVGLHLLRFALSRQGYDVEYLGIQNNLNEVFEAAHYVDAVLISCMDGHARYYLRDFAEHVQRLQRSIPWYLGGTPTLGRDISAERYFMDMGFRRVFLNYIEIEVILEALVRDLESTRVFGVKMKHRETQRKVLHPFGYLQDNKMDLGDFREKRAEVLLQWSTGSGCRDVRENASFLKSSRNWFNRHCQAVKNKEPPLIQPRCGVATLEGQLSLFDGMTRFGADVLSYQVDSLTRNNNYYAAEEAIRESDVDHSTLNGFPAVNHGVPALRHIARLAKTPIQCRHSTRDPRLLAEICYAGGVTAYEGGAISYNVPYYKSFALDESIRSWQYVDRLTSLYFDEFGIILDREFFGVLTGTLIPPCLAITVGIIESVLAAQQGVRSVTIGYAEQGNRAQDIAAISSINQLACKYLSAFGYTSIRVFTVFHQYMAAFPLDQDKARQLIKASSTTAKLSGATRMMTKTPVEAYRTPTIADNIEGVLLSREGFTNDAGIPINDMSICEERSLIVREVSEIIDSVIELGRGNLAAGVISAFRSGAIDIPFSPSELNAGLATTARDSKGAVRFIEFGNLPFSKDTKSIHNDKMASRRRGMGLDHRSEFKMVERDLLQVPRGDYERWPLT